MLNGAWKIWKGGFDRWERATADYLESTLRKPAVLSPGAAVLKAVTHGKHASDKLMALCWKNLGLPIRDEHDMAVHRINQLESKIMDLEEELEVLRKGASK